MKFYFATFRSPMYPEDNEIFTPGYKTEAEAEARCQEERSAYTNRPQMYQAKEWNWHITELIVDLDLEDIYDLVRYGQYDAAEEALEKLV